MKVKLLCSALLIASLYSNAQVYQSVPIQSGFNHDVIANGVGNSISSTTSDVDGVDYAFLSKDFKPLATSPDLTYGLPIDGSFSSMVASTVGLPFQLASYSGNNALRLVLPADSGLLNFSTPISANRLFMLATSGSGTSVVDVTITFTDSSTQTISGISLSDWYNGTNYAIYGIGRVKRSSNALESGGGTNPRLYQVELGIDAANQSKQIQSATITKVSGGGLPNIFAFSADAIVSCMPPSALTTTAVSANSATFSWTAPASVPSLGYDVYYSTSSTPPTVATTPNMSAVTGVSTTIAGLSPNTEYYVWMRSLCTSETGPWNGSYLKFKTSCAPVASLYEGFETTATGNFVPTCWERMAPSASAGSMSISTATPAAGTKNVYQYASTTQSPTIVALPEFSNVNAGTHWLRFKARTTVAGGTLSVGYVTDVTDVMSFVTIEDLTINNTSYTVPSAEYKVIVPNTLPSNARLAIKNKNDGKAYYWDEVNWEPVPTCLEPSDLAVSNITADGATLTWTASTSSPTGGYDVYYSTTNTAPTSTSTPNVNVNSTTANLSSLTDNTTYYVWVRSHCSSTDQSTWLALPSFKTSCLPVAYMYEGFESYASGSIVPDCWVRMAAATSAGSMSISTVTPATGTKNIYQYASATQTPTIVALPVFSNVDAGTHRLRFKARISSGTGGTLSVGYVTDINDLNSFVSLEDLTINNTTYAGSAAQYQVVIPNTVPSGARLALKNKNDAKSYYWDDIYWEPNSSCEEPTTLSVTNITTTAATVNWVAPATVPANGYDVYYSVMNTAPIPTTTPTTTVAGLTANLTSLNPSSVYYVWVRSRCSSTDQSPWVALPSFATACDAVNLPYVQNFDAVTVPALPNCTTNQNVGSGNNWTTIASPGYGFNSQVLRYSYSSSNAANAWFYTAGINLIAGTNYKISFDYGNNSTTYVEKMKVAFGTSADATAMTTQVVDLPNITGSAKQTVTYSFTVPTTGVYYFGFNAYSIANQYALYVDNINIDQDVLGTSEVNTKDGIMVYPNPFHDVVTISGTRDLKSVQVMDASGRLVKTIERPAAQLQLGDLKSGMYILQLVHRDGTTSSVKVMKK